jgi:hypothetical protein
MVVGHIFKGIKKVIVFKMPSDKSELVDLHNNLLIRLSSVPEGKKANMINSTNEIDRILN